MPHLLHGAIRAATHSSSFATRRRMIDDQETTTEDTEKDL
jgi:hypothetical protein